MGWDECIDEWQALAHSWQVRTFPDEKVFHLRPVGHTTGIFKSKIEQGYGAHYMAYHPLYSVVRGIRHMTQPPYVVGGLLMIAAYFQAMLQRRDQIADPALRRLIRTTQRKRLLYNLFGKRLRSESTSRR